MSRGPTKNEQAEQVLQDYISKLVDDKQELTRELAALRPRAEHFEEAAAQAEKRAEQAEAERDAAREALTAAALIEECPNCGEKIDA